jgi:hypothetical protein
MVRGIAFGRTDRVFHPFEKERSMTRKAWLAMGAMLAATMGTFAWADKDDDDGDGKGKLGVPQKVSAGKCDATMCRLRVKAADKCKVTVDPEWVFITGTQVQILWEIQSNDYVFPEVGGVEIKPRYITSEGFQDSRRLDERTWQIRDSNFRPDVARYAVTVVNRKTQESCTVDPGVVNDWP